MQLEKCGNMELTIVWIYLSVYLSVCTTLLYPANTVPICNFLFLAQ